MINTDIILDGISNMSLIDKKAGEVFFSEHKAAVIDRLPIACDRKDTAL